MSGKRNMNPELARERDGASIRTDELTYLWDGGRDKTERRRYIENIVFKDPDFVTYNEQNLTREEKYNETVRKHVLMWKKLKDLKFVDDFEKRVFLQCVLGTAPSGMLMHDAAFLPMLFSQSSDEQLKKWRPLVDSFRMVGCYAQTELGHGTFVRGLETTATYDPATKTFILNSPTLTSAKWWIGSLGLSCNHAVLLAQLHTNGSNHGIHAFLVQLRDIDTHQPLPGVTVGDIGPKLGFDEIDNGFLQLNAVRIPRENMLMRHSKVLEDGTFLKPPNEKLVYGGMLGIRANLPAQTAGLLAAAVTVAIRYSCVRRQSELKPNEPEVQVLDFQTQQHKLFPLLASAYMYCLTGHALLHMFTQVSQEMQSGNFKRLIEVHALSAGLKAIITTRAMSGVEQCRLSCGGHGYSLASGLPQMYGSAAAFATAEGEATVLLLQTARYLIKNCIQATRGGRIDLFMAYIQPSGVHHSFDGRIDLNTLVQAYECRASRVVMKVATRLQQAMAQPGMTQEVAWNECSVDLAIAATCHIDYAIVRFAAEQISAFRGDETVKDVLIVLYQIYALKGLVDNAGDLLEDGYLTSADLDHLRNTLYSLYKKVRPNAVALVDAFELHDRILKSVLGRFDGHVYEHLFSWASKSALNKTQVHESFHKYLKPLQGQFTKSQL